MGQYNGLLHTFLQDIFKIRGGQEQLIDCEFGKLASLHNLLHYRPLVRLLHILITTTIFRFSPYVRFALLRSGLGDDGCDGFYENGRQTGGETEAEIPQVRLLWVLTPRFGSRGHSQYGVRASQIGPIRRIP